MDLKELEARVVAAEPNGTLKFNIDHGSGNEGVWACFATPNDKVVYDRNKSGEPYEVFLMNHALIGCPSWGARLKLKAGGDHRPLIPVADVIQQMNDAVAAGDYPTPDTFS